MGPPSHLRYILPVVLLSSPYFTMSISTSRSHGQSCNGTAEPCDSSALLTCQDSICHCIIPDSMVFINPRKIGDYDTPDDHQQSRCVSLVEEPCGSMSLELDTPEVALECVINGFCNSQGECQCHSNYFKSDEGLCLNQRGFGEECTTSLECAKSLGLSCVNGKCQCNSTVSIDSLKFFDDEGELDEGRRRVGSGRHRCLGRSGQSCLGEGNHCVPNAVCREEHAAAILVGGDIRDRIKVKYACICEPGFVESKKKKVCVGSYNKTCDTQSNRFCRKDLSCMRGLCGCKHPSDQIYNQETQTCVSLLGGPCTNPGDCVTNAICKRLGENSITSVSSNNQLEDGEGEDGGSAGVSIIYEYCECDEGFVENLNRTCDVAYGHPCSQTLDGWKCDGLAGLTCRDGFCACPDPGQMYDMESMKCRGLVGSFCYRHVKDQCIKNAHCKPHRNGFLPFGHCECDEDHDMEGNRTCA